MEALAVIGPMLASTGSFLATNAPLIGAGITAAGTIYGGVRANQNAGLEAQILKKKGDDELAIASREAAKDRRQGNLALSRARAIAANSGAGTGDDTVTNIMAGIEEQRDYNVLTDMYRGQRSRADLYADASIRKREGRDALIGAGLEAGGTLYSGYARNQRAKREQAYYEDN